MSQQTPHLTKTDWLSQGFKALISKGPTSLRAEALARDIGATKGSFYWHFKDISAFQTQMITLWEAAARDAIALDEDRTSVEALSVLANSMSPWETTTSPILSADLAMRAWANENATARETVKAVDDMRLEELAKTLRHIGIANPDFSRAIYGAMIGLNSLPDGNREVNAAALSSLLAAVVALAES